MRFSVALTTYQSETFLQAQLDSLAAQSRLPDELVVCDDGSTDRTIDLLERFRASAPFPVRIFRNEKNLGYAQNFARAISLAEGEWIFLCDHDDYWLPQKLARFEKAIQAAPSLEAVFSDSALVDSALRPLHSTLFSSNRFHDYEKKYIRDGQAWKTFVRHNVIAGHALAFRSALRNRVLPIPAGWVHDAWIGSVLAASAKIGIIEEPLVNYRQHKRQHIGVISGGFFSRLRSRISRMGTREQLAKEAGLWRELAKHSAWQGNAATTALKEKISWLEGRAHMPDFSLKRLPFLAINFRRYFTLDNGWRTLLKDLFIS